MTEVYTLYPSGKLGAMGMLLSRGSCLHPGALPSLWARPFLSCMECKSSSDLTIWRKLSQQQPESGDSVGP